MEVEIHFHTGKGSGVTSFPRLSIPESRGLFLLRSQHPEASESCFKCTSKVKLFLINNWISTRVLSLCVKASVYLQNSKINPSIIEIRLFSQSSNKTRYSLLHIRSSHTRLECRCAYVSTPSIFTALSSVVSLLLEACLRLFENHIHAQSVQRDIEYSPKQTGV